jgi:hypothetical protein
MTPLNFIKNLLGIRKKASMPYEWAFVKWTDYARTHLTDGDESKIIEIYEGGKVVETFPYSEQHLEVLQKKRKIFIYDFTQGQSAPKIEIFKEYDPSTLEIK